MPDRYGFTWPFRDGTIVCLTCNTSFPAGMKEAARERHYHQHTNDELARRRREQAAQLREARRLKRLAERENHKLEERGLY